MRGKNINKAHFEQINQPKGNRFYFSKKNFQWMLVGLFLIVFGFILMLGKDANTTPDGISDPNYWNDDIFSVVRIRIAPLLILMGFVVHVFAILKKKTA